MCLIISGSNISTNEVPIKQRVNTCVNPAKASKTQKRSFFWKPSLLRHCRTPQKGNSDDNMNTLESNVVETMKQDLENVDLNSYPEAH
jgi:hypothetical protein